MLRRSWLLAALPQSTVWVAANSNRICAADKTTVSVSPVVGLHEDLATILCDPRILKCVSGNACMNALDKIHPAVGPTIFGELLALYCCLPSAVAEKIRALDAAIDQDRNGEVLSANVTFCRSITSSAEAFIADLSPPNGYWLNYVGVNRLIDVALTENIRDALERRAAFLRTSESRTRAETELRISPKANAAASLRYDELAHLALLTNRVEKASQRTRFCGRWHGHRYAVLK